MTYTDFFARVKKGDIARVYLFYGEEEYVRKRALAALREKLLPKGLEAVNETVLEGAPAAKIIDAAETLPMLADRRLTVVYDFAPLLGGKSRDEEAESDKIAAWLDRAPESGCAVFVVRGEGDGRKKLIKRMREVCGVAFPLLAEDEAARWAVKRAEELGMRMVDGAAEKLVFMAGRALTPLDAEIQKLAAYAARTGIISLQDIDDAVTPSAECTVFQMIDLATAGKPLEARARAKELIERGESRLGVVALIARQMRILAHASRLKPDALERALEISRFAAQRACRQAAALDARALADAYERMVEIDYAVKSGRMREEIALDEALYRVGEATKKGSARR